MARHRHLPRAPITEAVIDIRVRLVVPLSVDGLARLRSAFVGDFPIIEEQRSYEGLIQFDAGRVNQRGVDLGVVGLICRSEERHEAVQLSVTGFAFSKLRPYSSWEDVLARARALWNRYADNVEVEMINRLGVRYINQFGIPRHQNVDQYLTCRPAVPDGIDEGMVRNALTRLLLRDERTELSARLTQIAEVVDAGTNVIIDTDCFRAEEFPTRDDEFWALFNEMRDMKNRTFFGSITDKAAEEFE